MGEASSEAQAKARRLAECVAGPLQEAIRDVELASRELPEAEDFHFYCNFDAFKVPLSSIRERAQSVLEEIGTRRDLRTEISKFPTDAEDSYEWLVEVQDDILEGVGSALDELGVVPGKSQDCFAFVSSSKAKKKTDRAQKVLSKKKQRPPVPFHVKSLPRPQDKFDIPADNSRSPFRHLSREELLGASEPAPSTSIESHIKALGINLGHPLKRELEAMEFLSSFPCGVTAQKPNSLSDTPFTIVSLPSELKEMATKLRACREIAVDLENHHYRSFQGFVCLMQISTRSEDYVVDTLVLREHIGPVLRDIFANPSIRKVLHGADRDIVWLQRDFGIYVCNLFDTGQASRVLSMQSASLAFLLDKFCDIQADKRYQLADWRLRPLTSEMLKYAREDTHYLLYIYDKLQQHLHEAQLMRDSYYQVCRRSRDICLQLYEKEQYTATSFLSLPGLAEKNYESHQLAIVSALYAWRDEISRKEDESTGYVMPNHLIYRIAEEAPDEARKLHQILKGAHPVASFHAHTLFAIIRKAKSGPFDEIEALARPILRLRGQDSMEEGEFEELEFIDSAATGGERCTSVAVTVTASQQENAEVEVKTGSIVETIASNNQQKQVEDTTIQVVARKSTVSTSAKRIGGLGAMLMGKSQGSQVDAEARSKVEKIRASLALPISSHRVPQTTQEMAQAETVEAFPQEAFPQDVPEKEAANVVTERAEFEECIWLDGAPPDEDDVQGSEETAVQVEDQLVEDEQGLPASLSDKYGKVRTNRPRKRSRVKKTAKQAQEAAKPQQGTPSPFGLKADDRKDASRKVESLKGERQAEQRRHVFPRSGNRTAVFK